MTKWLFLLLLTLGVAHADPTVLTLGDAVKIGLASHPRIQRSHEDVQAAQAVVREIASDGRPKLFFEQTAKEGVKGEPNFGFLGIVQNSDIKEVGEDVAFIETFDFGRTRLRAQAQRAVVAAVKADERTQITWVVVKVVKSYRDLLLAQSSLNLEDWEVKARESVAHFADVRFKNGIISRVDVGLAQAGLEEARVRQIQARNNVQQAVAGLENAMGVQSTRPYGIAEPATPREPAESIEDDVQYALAHRPEIETTKQNVEAAKKLVRFAEGGYRPVLKVIASGGYQPIAQTQTKVDGIFVVDNRLPDTYAVGAGLVVPISTGGRVESDEDEAKHRLQSQLARLQEQENDIRLEVTQARLSLTTLLDSRASAAERVRQAADSERLATLRYQHGMGNIVEVQQAELSLLGARGDEAKLRYDTIVAFYTLQYVRGEEIKISGGY